MTDLAPLLSIPLLAWAIVYLLRGSSLAGCVAVVLVTSTFGYYFYHLDVGPYTITLDRVLVLFIAIAFVVQRRLGHTDPKPIDRGEWLLAAFILTLIVSTFTHEWRADRTGEVAPLWRLVAGYLVPVTIYWIARQSRLEERGLFWTLGALALYGVYLAITGVLEQTGARGLLFPPQIADPSVGLHFGRSRGPMVHAPAFGMYVTITMLAVWLWRRELSRGAQLALVLTIPLFLASIYFSYTRMVWLGAAVGALVVMALLYRGYRQRFLLAVTMASLVLLTFVNRESILSFRRDSSARDTRRSAYMRASFAYVSWMMFLDRPLVGVGFGQFDEAKLPYLADRTTKLPLESIRTAVHHITPLSVLVETGMIGLVLYLLVLARWTRSAWFLYRDSRVPPWMRTQAILFLGAFGVYVFQAMLREMSYSPEDHAIVFLLAGIVSGLRAQVQRSSVQGAARKDRASAEDRLVKDTA